MRVRMKRSWRYAKEGVHVVNYPHGWEGEMPEAEAKLAIGDGAAMEIKDAPTTEAAAKKRHSRLDEKTTKEE